MSEVAGKKFKRGQVVRLASGGSRMTVIKTITDNSAYSGNVELIWLDGGGHICRDTIHADLLEPIPLEHPHRGEGL